MDDMQKHATVLANYLTGGNLCKFGVHIILASSETIETFIAVYPVEFDGMGGGMIAAALDEAPIYEFESDDADFAEAFCAALNFFANEGDESA